MYGGEYCFWCARQKLLGSNKYLRYKHAIFTYLTTPPKKPKVYLHVSKRERSNSGPKSSVDENNEKNSLIPCLWRFCTIYLSKLQNTLFRPIYLIIILYLLKVHFFILNVRGSGLCGPTWPSLFPPYPNPPPSYGCPSI